VPNHKVFTIENSSNFAHRQKYVQAIVTLKSGRQMDNQVVEPKEDPIVLKGEEWQQGEEGC
jgi:hypothetical protein